ncbi:MAG: GTPase Era [Alphaproteobacteria bacterium]|nr:GTPase Era [Alphaproteobacteria bacterium]
MIQKKRTGFVAVIGPTNAGKSTLVNALVGHKVSIISRKVQTTRFNIRGILTTDEAQIVFVDTPGIFSPKNTRDKAMVRQAYGVLSDVEAVLLVLDVSRPLKDFKKMYGILKSLSCPVFLVMNKVDLVHPKEKLFTLTQELSQKMAFAEIFMIDSLHKKGLDRIVEKLSDMLPFEPMMYDEDQKSDLPLSLYASEIVREEIYRYLHEEVPYGIRVKTEEIEETEHEMRFSMVIYIARDNFKKIVVGNKAQQLKQIGEKSRMQLTAIFKKRVSVYLFVKADAKLLSRPEFEA